MPATTVHKDAKLILGKYGKKRIAIFTGRIHRYEGYKTYEMNIIGLLAALMGAQWLIVTNAAGGCLVGMYPGALMLIKDHMNVVGSDFLKSIREMVTCSSSRQGHPPPARRLHRLQELLQGGEPRHSAQRCEGLQAADLRGRVLHVQRPYLRDPL